MFNWIRRRRLSPEARQRLLLVAARAEEAIVETHVSNLLDMLDTLDGEIELDRAMDLYSEMMSLDEIRAETVTNRLLSRLEKPGGRGVRPKRSRNVFSQ
jgi:hypothetical protein